MAFSPFNTGGGADPRKFQPLPTAPTTPGLPSSAPSGGLAFTPQQQSQLQSAFSAAGIWDTIQNLGGDVWGKIANVLPKNADGSVDWGKVGGDVVGWVKNNKDTILTGLNVVNQYQRSQKSDEYAQKAVDAREKSYGAKEPLRVAGMAGMLNPNANTPDLSDLRARANAAPMQATLPVAGSSANLGNAQRIAGAGSGNIFGKPNAPGVLPPLPLAPSGPGQPPVVGRPGLTPTIPRPMPIGAGATVAPLPVAPLTPSGLPRPQSGPISAGPQDRQFGGLVPNPRVRIAALPIAGQMPPLPDDPMGGY